MLVVSLRGLFWLCVQFVKKCINLSLLIFSLLRRLHLVYLLGIVDVRLICLILRCLLGRFLTALLLQGRSEPRDLIFHDLAKHSVKLAVSCDHPLHYPKSVQLKLLADLLSKALFHYI